MARRGSRGSANRSTIATRSVLPPPDFWPEDSLSSLGSLVDVEDRRTWNPDPGRSAVTIGGRVARVVVHKRPFIAYNRPIWAYRGMPVGVQVPVGVMYESPFFVIRCLRRKVRKAVIFARGHGGKRGRKGRYNRNADSGIWCK